MTGVIWKHLARTAALFAWWTLWLILLIALGVQITVATRRQMGVPRPVLAALEERLLVAGMRADFGRARFDPTGRVLVEDVRLRFAGFEDPVIAARSVSVRLSLVALLAGQVEAKEIRISGLTARVPAMLSPSGTPDEVLANADLDLLARRSLWRVRAFTGWAGGVALAGQGDLLLPARRTSDAEAEGEWSARRYADWTRRAAAAFGLLGALERPLVRFQLAPGTAGNRIDFVVTADRLRLPGPAPLDAADLRVAGSAPLLAAAGSPVSAHLEAARASGPGGLEATRLDLWVDGRLEPAGSNRPVQPQRLRLAAWRLSGSGFAAAHPLVSIDLAAWPRLAASGAADLWGRPVRFRFEGDPAAREGRVGAAGQLDPAAVQALARWRPAAAAVVRWEAPVNFDAAAEFAAGAKFLRASAWIDASGVTARTVAIDELRARIEADPGGIRSADAFARLGDSRARGSFAQDWAGNYRFLLAGRLRPLAITPWIAGAWWADFFRNFDFPAEAPAANIDLQGCWTNGRKARVFLQVAAARVGFHGVGFDGLEGRIFARPQFTDALEFAVTRDGGRIAGTFARRYNLAADAWSRLDLQLDSSVAPAPILRLVGPEGEAALADIAFRDPPTVHFSGNFTGPGDPAGAHRDIHLSARAPALTFHRIPFGDAGFAARLQDDDLTVESAQASVAGGRASGSARLFGPASARRLRFDVTLSDLSLAQAVATAAAFAGKTGGVIKSGAAVRLNASAQAEGPFGDPYGFEGSGQIDLHGGEIGELHMLGALSQLLRFTALRFTAGSAGFQVHGRRLVFPTVEVIGANSAITAHGTCDLTDGELDFRARLNPFQQSHTLPQKFMDFVLTPISDVLEVRLTGTVNKPSWAFVNGPTNLLRSLSSPNGVAPLR